MPQVIISFEERVKKAKKVATQAINEAAKAATQPGKSRSTATRTSYKIKADALDEVARILKGRG